MAKTAHNDVVHQRRPGLNVLDADLLRAKIGQIIKKAQCGTKNLHHHNNNNNHHHHQVAYG